jgi:hypothetical protein
MQGVTPPRGWDLSAAARLQVRPIAFLPERIIGVRDGVATPPRGSTPDQGENGMEILRELRLILTLVSKHPLLFSYLATVAIAALVVAVMG